MGMNSKDTCLKKHASGPKQGTTGPQNAYTIGSEQIAVTNVNGKKGRNVIKQYLGRTM